MTSLNNEQLNSITGGAYSITGSLVSAFVEGIESVMNIGRSLGTAIRRLVYGNKCWVQRIKSLDKTNGFFCYFIKKMTIFLV